jgi:hypothetical protein
MSGRTCVRTSSNWYKMLRDMSERNFSWRENLKANKVRHFYFSLTGKKTICVENIMESMTKIKFIRILSFKQRV